MVHARSERSVTLKMVKTRSFTRRRTPMTILHAGVRVARQFRMLPTITAERKATFAIQRDEALTTKT